MQHAVVRAPLELEQTRVLARDVERTLVLLRDIGFPEVESHGQLLVVVFDERVDYVRFVNRATVGLFAPTLGIDLDGRPMAFVCACAGATADARAVMQHELTHYIMSQAYGATPRWVSEGMAQYFSTLTVRDGFAYVGLPDHERGVTDSPVPVRERNGRLLVPIDALFLPSELAFRHPTGRIRDPRLAPQAAYVSAYVLVHLLMNGPENYRERFHGYLERLRHGASDEASWSAAFGDMSPETLDDDFLGHARDRNMMLRRTPYTEGEPTPIAARGLPPAVIAATLARIEVRLGKPDLARAALARAISAHEEDAEVASWAAVVEGIGKRWEAADAAAARARAAFPNETQPLVAEAAVAILKVGAHAGTDEARLRSIIHELEPRARTPFELSLVSLLQVTEGRVALAVSTGRQAYESDRACRPCAIAYAAALEKSRRYEEAIEVEERVVNLSGHAGDAGAAARLATLRRLTGKAEIVPVPVAPMAPEPAAPVGAAQGAVIVPPFSAGNIPTTTGR